jgi:hypothetical protein
MRKFEKVCPVLEWFVIKFVVVEIWLNSFYNGQIM